MLPSVAGIHHTCRLSFEKYQRECSLAWTEVGKMIKQLRNFLSDGKVWTQATRTYFIFIFFLLGTPGEELSKEEKNLAIMAMKKKDKRAVRPYYAFQEEREIKG